MADEGKSCDSIVKGFVSGAAGSGLRERKIARPPAASAQIADAQFLRSIDKASKIWKGRYYAKGGLENR